MSAEVCLRRKPDTIVRAKRPQKSTPMSLGLRKVRYARQTKMYMMDLTVVLKLFFITSEITLTSSFYLPTR